MEVHTSFIDIYLYIHYIVVTRDSVTVVSVISFKMDTACTPLCAVFSLNMRNQGGIRFFRRSPEVLPPSRMSSVSVVPG